MKKNHLLNSKLITVLVCLFLTSVSFAKSQKFSTTFTVPAKVTTMQLQNWNGGGTRGPADNSSDRNVEKKYANRTFIGSGTILLPSEGLAFRGTGTIIDSQNYTFAEKPINGLITLPKGLFFEGANPSSPIMFRVANVPTVMTPINTTTDNNNDNAVMQDNFLMIRLGFNSANNYHRQILMGFMNEYATSGIDNGYDAFLLDDFPNDMYFLNGEAQLVIQGEGYFDANTNYPLGVKTGENGNVQFLLDDIINFDADQEVYIYDAETEMYHDIKAGPFEINLPIGLYETRFSLRFINPNALLTTADLDPKKLINIAFANSNNNLTIENNNKNLIVNTVTLFNILGQNLHTWELENESQTNMEIPIINYGTGTYVVKIQTSTGSVSKKIFIK